MSQIALPLETASTVDNNGYIVTSANSQVHEQLKNWEKWPHGTAILTGYALSGKSSMAAQFQSASNGYVLEDADSKDDDEIFHLWNRARQEDKPLLLVSEKPVSHWGVDLPDLKSRLASSLLIEIPLPDEAMVAGLLQKYFTARGLAISEDALSYLGKRMERSYSSIADMAQKMDALAIERKKSITLAIAREALNPGTDQTATHDEQHSVIKEP
ncbi:hypothetical protein MNBD_ALPHA04-2442 [hydrothermal vent metagenome]|uniref:Hda lid domain-containing protein n=1 Tax=hydrothermal vent metagenome TaxID=652676 RepID=A0A3B0R4G5_9ZZZZ